MPERQAQVAFDALGTDLDGAVRLVEQLDHRLAHQLAELLVQLAHAGFAGVTLDQRPQGRIVDSQAILRHAGPLQLAGPEMALGDLQLFLGDVTGQAHDFHAVQQRVGHRIERVGGADKQHLGQIQA